MSFFNQIGSVKLSIQSSLQYRRELICKALTLLKGQIVTCEFGKAAKNGYGCRVTQRALDPEVIQEMKNVWNTPIF